MGWVASAAIIAGTAIKAVSSIRGGYAAGEAADYNAAMARYESKYQKESAKFEEKQHRKAVARLIGEQAVSGAAAGAGSTGSDITPLLEIAKAGELDAALIRYGGEVGSWQAEQAAKLYGWQAGEYRTAGWLGAGSTLINTVGKYDWKKKFPSRQKPKEYSRAPLLGGGRYGAGR